MKNNPNRPDDELLRKLSALRDGELPPREAERLRRRLAADESARRAWEELEALDELLGQWPAPPVADVRGAVMARVRQDLANSSGARPRRWVPLAWAATWMLGGVLTGLSLWTGIDQRINDQIAAENLSQDMTLSMIMTEDWTPPIAIEEVPQP